MKDILIGLGIGFCVGVCAYFLVDGSQNNAAREAGVRQQQQVQAQLNLMQQMCPEVLKKQSQQSVIDIPKSELTKK